MNPPGRHADPAAVLRERARRLAAAADDGRARRTMQVLLFRLGSEEVALPVGELAEIAPFRGCTPVPGAPPAVRGVVNLRGSIRPVVDLAVLLGLEAPGPATDGTVLFLRRHGGPGLLVGAARSIDAVDPALLVRPEPETDQARRFLSGVFPGGFGLLDPDVLWAALAALESNAT